MIRFSFKVSNLERKQLAAVIADTIGETAKYAGAPTFQYHVGNWTIGKQCFIITPEMGIKDEHVTLRMVLDALTIAGAKTEENMTVTITMDGHNGNTLRNLVNLISSKQKLIQKALGWWNDIIPASFVKVINEVPIDTLEDFVSTVNNAIEAGEITGHSDLDIDLVDKTICFNFFNATLNAQEIRAFGVLCWQLNEQAKKQKFTSVKQKETENDKYAFRCFLLKLGFIGDAFKSERKVLLARLSGDGAFRTEEAREAAEAKRKGTGSDA